MYGMFTEQGNQAVAAIVEDRTARGYNTAEELFYAILEDLDKLQDIPLFSEATDTEVRESVYTVCIEHFKEIA